MIIIRKVSGHGVGVRLHCKYAAMGISRDSDYICEVERRQASISILHNIVFTIAL
jgi:hypothetical protein